MLALNLPLDKLRIALELPSNEALCTAVASSQLATAVSRSVAQAGLSAGDLIALPLQLPTRDFSIITHKERTSSKAATAFRQGLGLQHGK